MSLYIIESLHKDLTIVVRETETSNRIRSLLVPKKIFAEDMNDEDLESVINFAKDSMALTDPTRKTVMSIFANHIRERMTSHTGKKGWNVVSGRTFGAFVTHELRSYAFFTVCPGVNILVWRG